MPLSPFRSPRSCRSVAIGAAVLLGAAVSGCFNFGPIDVEFPPGLEPLEENKVPKRTLKPGAPAPVELDMVFDGEGDFSWAHGRGWLDASMSRVWEVLQNPDVVVDRREVAEWSVTTGVEPEYDHSWRIHNVVKNPLATVSFHQTYRMAVVAGTEEDPEAIMIRAEMTAADNPFITAISDSLIVYRVFDDVAEVELIRQRDSLMNSADGAVDYLRDVHASLRAAVAGEPLPQWK